MSFLKLCNIFILSMIFIVIINGCDNTSESEKKKLDSNKEMSKKNSSESPSEINNLSTHCKNQRPEVCSQIYEPVCATRDTGIRCIKAPCPAREKKTYSNACMACRDSSVIHYVKGACEVNIKKNKKD